MVLYTVNVVRIALVKHRIVLIQDAMHIVQIGKKIQTNFNLKDVYD